VQSLSPVVFLAGTQNVSCFYNSELAGSGCVRIALPRATGSRRNNNSCEEVRDDCQYHERKVIDRQGQTVAGKDQGPKFEKTRPGRN
jgi:hypothetical protein